jgi:uncharacterized membrane protein
MNLLGIGVMIVGILFRLNTLLVILVAGVTTCLLSGMLPMQILNAIGRAFVANRFMALFILIMPVIGVLERHGLREKAESLIMRMRHATAGQIILFYMFFRQIAAAFGLQMDGQLSFVWPIVSPMAEAAAVGSAVPDPKLQDRVRSMAAASENFGNSYGNLMFVAGGGLLLIKSVLLGAGYQVDLVRMAVYAIPSGIAALLICAVYFLLFDAWIERRRKSSEGE